MSQRNLNMKNKVENVNWHVEWATVSNKYGSLLSYSLPSIHSQYAECKYQPYITEMLESKKYAVFLDVGAFVGFFSQIASHNCSYVCAYEAQPFFFGILLNNMKFFKNVDCEYKYVSCEGDIPKTDNNFMGLLTIDSDDFEYNIDVISLDEEWDVPKDYLMLIKMDIEGNELKALEGSKKLIESKNIHWIIDVHPPRGVELDDVKKYFTDRKITQIGAKVLKIE